MEDDTSDESKNKIAELKHRLNQMYAQYFSDTKEGRVFESEFSLYAQASEHALREKSEQRRLQYGILRAGIFMLVASSAFIVFFFRESILFSTVFLLGLGFFACGFIYLMLSSEISIMRAERFSSDLVRYFQQHRWNTESKQNLHLPEMPLWEGYQSKTDMDSSPYRQCIRQALYIPLRIAISFIDLLALAFLFQFLLSGQTMVSKAVVVGCFVLWLAAVVIHMMLVRVLLVHAESVFEPRGKDREKGTNREKPASWTHIIRLFFLLDIIFPRAPITPQDR